MTKSPNPNSLRSKRRAKRNFTGSRPVRRAAKRAAEALGGWNKHPKSPEGDHVHKKPGATHHW